MATTTPPEPVKDYAFNVNGWATPIPGDGTLFSGHLENLIFINARGASSTTYQAEIKYINDDTVAFRQSLLLSAEECQETDNDTTANICRYVVVGLIPLKHENQNLAQQPGQTDRRMKTRVGVTAPTQASIIQWDLTSQLGDIPLIAVAKASAGQKNLKIYALLRPHEGLCTPFPAPQEQVFYLPRFRTADSKSRNRNRGWNLCVLNALLQASGDNDETQTGLTSKQKRLIQKIDALRIQFHPNISLKNEILGCMARFNHSHNRNDLEQMLSILQLVKSETQERLPQNEVLHLFVESDNVISMEQAGKFIEELTALWPQFQASPVLTADNVLLVHKALIYLRTDTEYLEYSELRNFIGLILSHLDRTNKAGDSVTTTEMALIVDSAMQALRVVWTAARLDSVALRVVWTAASLDSSRVEGGLDGSEFWTRLR
jgi:hypothetical protein